MTQLSDFSPIRYTGARHTWNNGFRQMWISNGRRNADTINAARRGNLNTVLAHVATMGGGRGGIGIAKSLIKTAQKLDADVPGYKIVTSDCGQRMLCIAHVTWGFSKAGRQIGKIEWLPIFGVSIK